MVAKNDIATTARPPATLTRTRPTDDRMADLSPRRSGRIPGRTAGTRAATALGRVTSTKSILHACLSNRQGLVTTPRDPATIADRRPSIAQHCRNTALLSAAARTDIFSEDVTNGTPARNRNAAAQGDETRLPRAHERRQSPLHGE